MRAMLCKELGGPSSLRLGEIAAPAAGPGEVLVRVRAAGVNFPDVLMTRGGYQLKPTLPFVPGMEAAGEIAALGAGVSGWAAGQRVIAGTRVGAFAEFVCAKAEDLWALPDAWSFAEGAGFRVGAMTAFAALEHGAAVKTGETVLVHGATGGMGLAAVQLAKLRGAVVIATGSSDAKLAVVARQGADHVVNLTRGDWVAEVKALTDKRGADVVFDPVGGEVLLRSLSAAAAGGRLLVIGFTSGGPTQLPSNHILIKRLSVIGVRAGENARGNSAIARDYAETLPALMRHDTMRPHISLKVPLERASEALTALVERRVVGKAVVEVA